MGKVLILLVCFFAEVYTQIISWELVTSGNQNIWDIKTDALGYLYFGYNEYGIGYSYDDGDTWNFSNPPNDYIFRIITFDKFIFATEEYAGGLWKSTDSAQTWSLTYNINLSRTRAFHYSGQGYIYSGSEEGHLNVSKDTGATWSTVDINYQINTIATSSNGYVYAGTDGGIYVSTDFGTTWNKIINSNIDFYVNSIVINHNDQIFATHFYGISTSTDLGNTWYLINNMYENHHSVLALDSSNNLILAARNKGIYRSFDGALSWQFIGGPSYAYSIAVKGRKIFVGAHEGVWRYDPDIPTVPNPNFFPLSLIKSFCVTTDWSSGYNWGGTYYNNTYYVPDTMINSEKYYKYKFKNSTFFLRHDSVEQKTYIYIPYLNNSFLYADYNLNKGDSVVLYLDGTSKIYEVTKADTVLFLNYLRKRMAYGRSDYAYWEYTFYQGIGLYTVDWDYPYGPYSESEFDFISAAIIDTSIYNQFFVYIDSTSIRNDRPIDTFPFTIKVYPRIEDPHFMSKFFIEFNVFRADTLFLFESLDISSTNFAFVPYDSSIINVDDIIKYRVIYEDTSIFLNRVLYPAEGYVIFKVIPVISDVNEKGSNNFHYSLLNPYPNPFNPAAKIRYTIESGSYGLTTLKIYDIMGNEIALLVNEEQPAGEYEIEFDGSYLASGVYFYQLRSGKFVETKKMILMR